MILQALRAELLKLGKNRWTLFWAFCFVPLFLLLVGFIDVTFVRPSLQIRAMGLGGAQPFKSVLDGLSAPATSIYQLLPIVGAASLFAGEYRWETWRSILTRIGRAEVMIAKFILFAIAATFLTIAAAIAQFLVGIYQALMTGQVSWPTVGAPELVGAVLLAFAATFLQLMATGALVLATAVATRSTLASIVATFLLLVGCDILSLRFMLDPDWFVAALPNMAGRSIREFAAATAGDPDAILLHLAPIAPAFLIGWTAILAVAGITLFRRQDLSRE